jgi:hypothetical protein
MDVTVSTAASQKAIDTLKATPLWLFAGVALSCFVVWVVPPFRSALPETVQAWLPVAFAASLILALCKATSVLVFHRVARQKASIERSRQKLMCLYRPLASLFFTRHVTIVSACGAPRLRHRVANAWLELGAYRHRMVGVKRALRALFDRQTLTSAEVEFGGEFPLMEIVELTRLHAEHADTALLTLVRRANRSRYEDRGSDFLTDAEFALFQHINAEHDRLSCKVAPESP